MACYFFLLIDLLIYYKSMFMGFIFIFIMLLCAFDILVWCFKHWPMCFLYLSISHFSMSAAERRHMVYTSITMSDEGDWISDDFPFDDDSTSATSHPMVSWYITMLMNTKHAITSNRLRLYGFVHGVWTWLKTHIN